MKNLFKSESEPSFEETKNIWNKIGKDRLTICILGGLLLVVIAMPVEKKSTKTENSKTESTTITSSLTMAEDADTEESVTTLAASSDKTVSSEKEYSEFLSSQLENILKYMDGVGKVKVLVTMENSGELVVEKDSPFNRSNTIESDSEGGSRNISDMENQEETVYITDSQGNKTPYVIKEISPLVKGVVVVAEGGGDERVVQNITEALSALFDIAPEKVKVLKMR